MIKRKKVRGEGENERTFWVLGLPHTTVDPAYCWCAYTQKIRRFVKMLKMVGKKVELIDGSEFTDAIVPPDSQVSVISWDPNHKIWKNNAKRVVTHLLPLVRAGDVLCMITGCHKLIYTTLNEFVPLIGLEYGIGYGSFINLPTVYACFESSTWRTAVYGATFRTSGYDPRPMDTVIPNSYDEDELSHEYLASIDDSIISELFTPSVRAVVLSGKYLLFIGRNIKRKGIEVAENAALHLKMPLIIAGQTTREHEFNQTGSPLLHHVGMVSGLKKAILFNRALCTVVYTLYEAPFEGVHVESMLCGTPVITSNQGIFITTVQDGVNGWKCHNDLEYITEKITECKTLDKQKISNVARSLYTCSVVSKQYEKWIEIVIADWESQQQKPP